MIEPRNELKRELDSVQRLKDNILCSVLVSYIGRGDEEQAYFTMITQQLGRPVKKGIKKYKSFCFNQKKLVTYSKRDVYR